MKLKVLIVDDDPIVIYLHNVVVVESGFSTIPFAFSSCKEALEFLHKASSDTEAFLVLLDISMPVMSGWEFLDSLTKDNLPVPVFVVLVTSSIEDSDKKKAAGYKCVIAFVEKPIRAEDLDRLKKLEQIKKYF